MSELKLPTKAERESLIQMIRESKACRLVEGDPSDLKQYIAEWLDNHGLSLLAAADELEKVRLSQPPHETMERDGVVYWLPMPVNMENLPPLVREYIINTAKGMEKDEAELATAREQLAQAEADTKMMAGAERDTDEMWKAEKEKNAVITEQMAQMREALAGLVANVADYEAWKRPCLVLDTAKTALTALPDARSLASRNAELERAAQRTDDGVLITTGMMLYWQSPAGIISSRSEGFLVKVSTLGGSYQIPRWCYSTEAAARAAMEGKK